MVLGREQEIAEYSTVALGSGRDAPPPVSSRLWIRNGRKDVFKEIAFFCLFGLRLGDGGHSGRSLGRRRRLWVGALGLHVTTTALHFSGWGQGWQGGVRKRETEGISAVKSALQS